MNSYSVLSVNTKIVRVFKNKGGTEPLPGLLLRRARKSGSFEMHMQAVALK